MKLLKRAVIFATVFAVLSSCFCISAGATKRHWAFSTNNFYDSGQSYFNAEPANKMRFVATPRCSVSTAVGYYNLYRCYWDGATIVPRQQYKPVNKQIRSWWGKTHPGNYSMTVQIRNNYISSSSRATVNYPSAWLENFDGDLWVSK